MLWNMSDITELGQYQEDPKTKGHMLKKGRSEVREVK